MPTNHDEDTSGALAKLALRAALARIQGNFDDEVLAALGPLCNSESDVTTILEAAKLSISGWGTTDEELLKLFVSNFRKVRDPAAAYDEGFRGYPAEGLGGPEVWYYHGGRSKRLLPVPGPTASGAVMAVSGDSAGNIYWGHHVDGSVLCAFQMLKHLRPGMAGDTYLCHLLAKNVISALQPGKRWVMNREFLLWWVGIAAASEGERAPKIHYTGVVVPSIWDEPPPANGVRVFE